MSMTMDSIWRALPDAPEIIAKIRSGEYTVHGGVVRGAAGTNKAGQIIAHLRFPTDAQQAQQSLQELRSVLQNGLGSIQSGMDQLQQSMNVLQGLQTANLVLSGLNLAVSTAGFIIVCKKLDRVSDQVERQSQAIGQLLSLAGEARDHNFLRDEANFRALVLSAQTFANNNDIEHLRTLIPECHRQYQFTKLVLQRHASRISSNMDRFDEVELLQERLVHVGLLMSHIHVRLVQPQYSKDSLLNLSSDIKALNKTRIDLLSNDQDIASQMLKTDFTNVISFLNRGKQMLPALDYEKDLLQLEIDRPTTLIKAPENGEIMLLAA